MVKSLLASSTVITPLLIGSKEDMTEGGSSWLGSGVLAPLIEDWVFAGPSGWEARLRNVAIGAAKAIELTVLRRGDSTRAGTSWTAEGGELSSCQD